MRHFDFVESDMISGVYFRQLKKYNDSRGWLMEFFRHDELDSDDFPAMGYVSMTMPNVTRGPHEHIEQTDIFAFIGQGEFLLALWDNRDESKTFANKTVLAVGGDNPCAVIVPPRVVHAYHCISKEPGLVLNVPNRLFKGENKATDIDEIRHEDDSKSPYARDLADWIEEMMRCES